MPLELTAETFGPAGRPLRGVLQWPCQSDRLMGLVMCPPFGEERKAVARVMTLAGAAFADCGYPVLRFDYHGTGESDGWMEDVSLTDWLADIEAAVEHLVYRTGVREVGLCGLRFGATLVALCESAQRPPSFLVLWAPQMTGAETLVECRRHLAATRLVSAATDAFGAQSSVQGDRDMGGFILNDPLRGQIESIRLPSATRARAFRVVIVQFSSRTRVSQAHQDLCQSLTASAGAGRAFSLPVRPFWVTAGRFNPRDLVDRTVQALNELAVSAPSIGGISR